MRTLPLAGVNVPVIGQGTWRMGEDRSQHTREVAALRLGIDHIDLYLLHWRGQYPLEETVEAFERLREAGKIGRWGVSNFDVDDLQELAAPACTTNQVLYNLQDMV